MVSILQLQSRSARGLGGMCAALVSVAMVTGCTKPLPVSFRLDMQLRDPAGFDAAAIPRMEQEAKAAEAALVRAKEAKNVDEKKLAELTQDAAQKRDAVPAQKARIAGRQKIATALYSLFGSPDDPWVFPESGLDLYKIRLASGPVSSDENGEQRGLYRQHCAHCHGISGDGAGPTAAFLTPYPRDYRKGIYKFKANELAQKPSNDDLHRILREGINGTAMPSFLLLPEQERDSLIEYVKYLSMRGEMEILLASQIYEDDTIELTRDFLVTDGLSPLAENWSDEKTGPIQIPAKPEVTDHVAWAKAGAELFKGPKAQCAKCHGPNGLGDGSEELLFDEWNKEKKQTVLPKEIAALESDLARYQPPPGMKPEDAEAARDALRKQIASKREQLRISLETSLLPEQQIQPRNLRLGLYRFGRNTTDTYKRIHAGIAGTPMPAGGKSLSPTEIWQLVDYVKMLPFDQRVTSAAASPAAERAHN